MAEHLPDDRIAAGTGKPPPSAFQAGSPEPAALPSLAGGGATGEGLSSLAQSAREKQINRARTILLVVGVLTILANVGFMFLVQSQIDAELRKQGVDRRVLLPEQKRVIDGVVLLSYDILGGFAAMGVVFLILGVKVRQYPVACTVTGLVLYILGGIVSLILSPESFVGVGLIIKIVIIVALFQAVQAALAAEREKQAALAGIGDEL